jgi:NarL family two-component system sensor histidine kinase YdfH
MQNKSPIPAVERDPRLFMGFMSIVVGSMYVVSLLNTPMSPLTVVIFTALVLAHLALHWMLEIITARPNGVTIYLVVQGILVFIISWMSGQIGLMLAIFMGMLGETVGLFGLTRRGLLASTYFIALMLISLTRFSEWLSIPWFTLSLLPMLFFVIGYVALYMRQLEARQQAQTLAAELETANRQLSEYAAQVEDLTIANERQRMARELHDTLSQGLAGIILQLEAVEAHLASNRPEKAQNIIASAKQQARATLADARAAIDDLRKPSLDNLDSALRLEISRFTDATGLPCIFHADSTALLPAPVAETIIRAVAESLTNIARHAQAKKVEIDLKVNASALQLTIQDDGQGFDPQAIPSGHYGLLGIRERLRLHDGQLTIDSAPSKGTILAIEIPLSIEGQKSEV